MASHWFFSLGTGPKHVTYQLPDGRERSNWSVLPALLSDRPVDPNITFWPLTTEQLDQAQNGAPSPRDRLRAELGPWEARVFEKWGTWPVDDRDLWKIVDRILRTIKDGDEVRLELTNGLRHVILGLLLGTGLALALRPKVRLVRTTYAEIDSRKGRGTVYDITDLLELFQWSAAANALARLDATPLVERLDLNTMNREAHEGRLDKEAVATLRYATKQLQQIAVALRLGWHRKLTEPLSKLPTTVDLQPVASHARVPMIHLVQEAVAQLADLSTLAHSDNRDQDDVLDEERLALDLHLVERLRDAGRWADAIRLLREWMVNAELLHGLDRADDWLEHSARAEAEAELHQRATGAIAKRWKEVGQARNGVSHGGYAKSLYGERGGTKTYQELLDSIDTLRSLSPSDWRFPRARAPKQWIASSFSLNMVTTPRSTRVSIEALDVETARSVAAEGTWSSCVGHEDTAALLSRQLGLPVPCNRTDIALHKGDQLLVGQRIGDRLPPGTTTLPPDTTIQWFLVTTR